MKPLQKWLEIWFELEDQIAKLPPNKQDALFEDMKTALKERLRIMETTKDNLREIE